MMLYAFSTTLSCKKFTWFMRIEARHSPRVRPALPLASSKGSSASQLTGSDLSLGRMEYLCVLVFHSKDKDSSKPAKNWNPCAGSPGSSKGECPAHSKHCLVQVEELQNSWLKFDLSQACFPLLPQPPFPLLSLHNCCLSAKRSLQCGVHWLQGHQSVTEACCFLSQSPIPDWTHSARSEQMEEK